jgi:hypothetical protein
MLSQKESYSLEAQNQPQLPSIPSAPPTYSELLATNNRQIIVPSTTIYNPILLANYNTCSNFQISTQRNDDHSLIRLKNKPVQIKWYGGNFFVL